MAAKTRERFERGRDEFPLTVCLGALATGLLTAIAIPATRREDIVFGEQSDEIKDKARQKGEELHEDAVEAAREATGKAKEELHKQGLDPEELAGARQRGG